jgi:hypothetical protein
MSSKLKFGVSIIVALGILFGAIAPVFAQTATPPAAGDPQTPPQQGGNPWISQIAQALSMSADDLQTAISSGKTIEALAKEKSVDLSTLIDTLLKTVSDRYAQDVTAGKMTQTEADSKLSEMKTALNEWFTTGKMPDSLNMQPVAREFVIVADVLGTTTTDLQAALDKGQKIADLVTAKSLTLDTFISAVVTKRTEELTKSVTDGKMTQTDADKAISDLKTALTDWYNTNEFPAAWKQHMRVNKEELAKALGLTVDELDTALKAGKTVSDLATAKSLTLDALATTLLASVTEKMTADVTAGKMTQADADKQLASMKADLIAVLQSGKLDDGQGGPAGMPPAGTPPAGAPAAATPAASATSTN